MEGIMTGKVIATYQHKMQIDCGRDCPMKPGDVIVYHKKRSKRSPMQNGIYWAYLRWCIDNGLMQQGHFSIDGLHEDIKAWVKEVHPNQFSMQEVSTADMNVLEFGEYIQIVDTELMAGFFNLNTSGFWAIYETFKSWQGETGGSWREFMQGD
jgi:hypothetical protein